MKGSRSAILNNRLYEVGSVRKALEILCAFNGGPPSLGVADVSRQLGMPKSTTHNLLQTLESLDFLRQDPADRRYRLGPRLYELGLQYSHSTHLISSAAPHLQSLGAETKETVKLGVLSGDEVLIVAAVESPYQLHTRGDLGTRAPLHCTGLGKAILATLGAEEVTAITGRRGLARYTAHSITSVKALQRELDRVRTCGFATDLEENEEGVVCAAAAIEVRLHREVAAVSVSGPSSRVDAARLKQSSNLVVQTARAIEKALGQA
jgi:DNA-binding IclR family transcriptional regulator